jgi:hypothetical protein
VEPGAVFKRYSRYVEAVFSITPFQLRYQLVKRCFAFAANDIIHVGKLQTMFREKSRVSTAHDCYDIPVCFFCYSGNIKGFFCVGCEERGYAYDVRFTGLYGLPDFFPVHAETIV